MNPMTPPNSLTSTFRSFQHRLDIWQTFPHWGDLTYSEYSGRNDIIGAKVARDEENLYFYVECNENITPYTDPLWMVLYIDSDQTNQGWETFDYVLNKTSPSAGLAVLDRFTGNGYETETVGEVEYTVNGKYMQVKVPKSMLNLSSYDFTVNFTWTDNVHDEDDRGLNGNTEYVYTRFSGDIMDFYTSGDVAPSGRFKYSYIFTYENATGKPAPETEPETFPETDPDTQQDGTLTDGDTETISEYEANDTDTEKADGTPTPSADGCASTVGMCVVFILPSAAAFMRRKKRRID